MEIPGDRLKIWLDRTCFAEISFGGRPSGGSGHALQSDLAEIGHRSDGGAAR